MENLVLVVARRRRRPGAGRQQQQVGEIPLEMLAVGWLGNAALRQGLVSLQFDAHLVGPWIEEDRLEVAAAVRDQLLRLAGGRIRDFDGSAGNDAAAV
jgi:hypothetical protein